MNREEIEAAAARAGVRITGYTGKRYWFGPHHCLVWPFGGGGWRASCEGQYISGEGVDEALGAIAADIDEIASVRVGRTAEDERADVVAWVVEYRETCEFPDVRDIRDAIKTGEHVGAAGDE